MKQVLRTAAAGLAVCAQMATANAQAVRKSYSSGLFVGLGAEGNGIVTRQSAGGSSSESGGGGGLLVGYGFTPRWSAYLDGSAATIKANGGGNYGLAHFDVGARVHFRTGPNIVVPFLQFGLSGRAENQTVTSASGTHEYTSTGSGIIFGGGMSAYVTPSFAFSTSVTVAGGTFTHYEIDKQVVSLPSVSATSSRLHLGAVWFPRG